MAFEQATIKVEKEQEFGELKSAITRAFAPENVQKYLKRVASAGIRVRDFDMLLAKGVFEQVEGALLKGSRAQELYSALTISDKAQIKEFYLSKVEEVGADVRAKFHKIYQYY